jgi:acyl dehydratase
MAELAFADLREGQAFALGPYAVTRDAILAFAAEFDPQPFHLDEEVANASILGGLAASGWHTMSIMFRMLCDAFSLKLDVLGTSTVDELKWLKPVYVDDVLTGTMTITSLRKSQSQPDRGIVTFNANVFDQHGEAKAFLSSMYFVKV